MSEEAPQRPRCMHLYCKSMLVFGEAFETDPEYRSGLVDFTCTCTSQGIGPDGGEVSLSECSNPGRECFQEY